MFSELTSFPLQPWLMKWCEGQKTWSLNPFWRRWHFVMCKNTVLLWRWRSIDSVVLKFERCEHRDDTSIVDADQEGVKCSLPLVLKDQVTKVPPWVVRWSCMAVLVVCEVWEVCWILKGFWLCQCFCWVMDLWYKCEMYLLLDGVGCCCLCLLLWNPYVLLLGDL